VLCGLGRKGVVRRIEWNEGGTCVRFQAMGIAIVDAGSGLR